jgi:hypothetical protein
MELEGKGGGGVAHGAGGNTCCINDGTAMVRCIITELRRLDELHVFLAKR